MIVTNPKYKVDSISILVSAISSPVKGYVGEHKYSPRASCWSVSWNFDATSKHVMPTRLPLERLPDISFILRYGLKGSLQGLEHLVLTPVYDAPFSFSEQE